MQCTDIPTIVVARAWMGDNIGLTNEPLQIFSVFGFENLIRRIPSQFHMGRVDELAVKFVNTVEIGAGRISES